MDWEDSLKNLEKSNKFNERLTRLPRQWRGAVAVVDSFDIVKQGLLSTGIDDPFVLTEAVRLVLERYDRAAADLAESAP